MAEETVLQKQLAVIGHDDYDRVAINARLGERPQEPPQNPVPVGDGGVVQLRVVGEVTCHGFRRVFGVTPLLHYVPPGGHNEPLTRQRIGHVPGKG